MRTAIQKFTRQYLLDGLGRLPDEWRNTFKLLYGRKGGKRSVEDAKAMSVADVVAEISDDQLDWAMQQVDSSIAKMDKQKSATQDHGL